MDVLTSLIDENFKISVNNITILKCFKSKVFFKSTIFLFSQKKNPSDINTGKMAVVQVWEKISSILFPEIIKLSSFFSTTSTWNNIINFPRVEIVRSLEIYLLSVASANWNCFGDQDFLLLHI